MAFEFEEDSEDYLKRGQPLAGGYSAVLFLLRSDLEFLANHFGMQHPSSNSPCTLCKADRSSESRPWTDCRATAAWRTSLWKPDEWLAEHSTCHNLFRMPGGGLDLVSPDLMHCKHLGTDQLLLGSVLTWLVKHYLSGTNAQNLAIVWEFIQTWYKDSLEEGWTEVSHQKPEATFFELVCRAKVSTKCLQVSLVEVSRHPANPCRSILTSWRGADSWAL